MTKWVAALPIVRDAYRSSMDTLRILHNASDPISLRPGATTSPCMGRSKSTAHFADDEDSPRARKSTGSFTTRESLEWQRHTFTALPSSLVELARRSTEDMPGSHSLPPRSAPSTSSRSGTHVQHLRVYGRPLDANGNELVREYELSGEPFVEVKNPDPVTVWSRGKAAGIEWTVLDDSVETVHIELLEHGSSATTVIAKDAPNNGSFLYTKVPWGMAIGDKYILRISDAADPSRYMTTCFFAIDSTP